MKNFLRVSGVSTLRAFPRGTCLPCYVHRRKNLVVQAGNELIADLILNVETSGLTYHALGTSATAPVSADTAMGAEATRKAWTSKTRIGSVITFNVFYLAEESTYNIRECGVFGGLAASAAAGSGKLFSHFLQSYDNSAGLVDLSFEYELTIGGS